MLWKIHNRELVTEMPEPKGENNGQGFADMATNQTGTSNSNQSSLDHKKKLSFPNPNSNSSGVSAPWALIFKAACLCLVYVESTSISLPAVI